MPTTPNENEELDLSGLTGRDHEDHEDDLIEEARELQFLSGSLDADEHAKQAAIRMDAMVGEIADNMERQTAAIENIATGFARLLEILEPVAEAFGDQTAVAEKTLAAG